MKILLFAGSLRVNSFNKKLVYIVHTYLNDQGIESTLIDLVNFVVPIYNEDIEKTTGIPELINNLTAYVKQADALFIATPEYNGSISSPLKNIVDWLSRCKPMRLVDKHLLLASASPGQFGGVRGIWHTRVPFEMLGVHVFPTMFSLPLADKQFDGKNQLIDQSVDERLKKIVDQFVRYVKQLK